jgi:hypothetical protein
MWDGQVLQIVSIHKDINNANKVMNPKKYLQHKKVYDKNAQFFHDFFQFLVSTHFTRVPE